MAELPLHRILQSVPVTYQETLYWRLHPRGGRIETFKEGGSSCVYTWEWNGNEAVNGEVQGRGASGLQPYQNLAVSRVLRVGSSR